MAKPSRAVTIQSMPKMSGASSSSSGQSQDNRVRIIPRDEYKAAADSLAEAFRHDDVATYFIDAPDTNTWTASERWEVHVKIMRSVVLAHCIKGLALTVGPNHDAVALWMPPGKNMDDRLTMFRSGMWQMERRLSKEGKLRFKAEFLPLLHRTKSEVLGNLDNDSWYLVYIGTEPKSRGKGYARMLIEYVTRQADSDCRVCYLESSNGINPAIYQRFGFEIVKKIQLTRGTKPVDLDIMVRQPKPVDASSDVRNIEHHGQTAETA